MSHVMWARRDSEPSPRKNPAAGRAAGAPPATDRASSSCVARTRVVRLRSPSVSRSSSAVCFVRSTLFGGVDPVRWALAHRKTVVGTAAGAFVGSFVLFGVFNPGLEFFPESVPPKQVFVDVELPVGTRVEETDAIVQRVEQELQAVPGRQDWRSSVSVVGSGGAGGASDMMGQGGPGGPEAGRVGIQPHAQHGAVALLGVRDGFDEVQVRHPGPHPSRPMRAASSPALPR